MQQYGSNNIVLILKDTIFEHFEVLSFSIKKYFIELILLVICNIKK